MLTPNQLSAIRKRADAATKGPWVYERFEMRIENEDGDRKELWWTEWDEIFTAHARQAVPALLDEVERLREENSKLQSRLTECHARANIAEWPEWKQKACAAVFGHEYKTYSDFKSAAENAVAQVAQLQSDKRELVKLLDIVSDLSKNGELTDSIKEQIDAAIAKHGEQQNA